MATRKSSRRPPKDVETYTVALAAYDAAMKALHDRNWKRAGELLSSFVNEFSDKADISEMVDRARLHLASCDARQAAPADNPATGNEWLLAAVCAANDGNLERALASLDEAANQGVPPSRTEYVRAAALASADRNDEALASLARAIEADPENRAFSLGDPDFERLRETAGYVSLVEPPDAGTRLIDEVMSHGQETGSTETGGA